MGAGVKTGTSVDVDVLRDKLRDALAKSGGVSCMVDTYAECAWMSSTVAVL